MCKKRIDGVYLIKNNVTLRVRVGSAKDIQKRFSNYKARLRGGNGNKLMQDDFNEYGEQSFEFIILEECLVKDLYVREKHYLEEVYDDCTYYNKNAVKNLEKRIRRGLEAKNYKEKRSVVTSGENNGHNTKLSEEDVFAILNMLKAGVNREIIAEKYNIYPAYTYRIGKDRWVKAYEEWKDKEKTVSIGVDTVNLCTSTNVQV